MNLTQLRQLAQRRALVRWFPSGCIERLRETRSTQHPHNPIILAGNLITNREHPIRPFQGQTEFFCTEIDPKETVLVGDLLPR